MLYHLYEAQRAALLPVRVAADHARHLLRNPLNPASYTYPGRVVAAACDVFEHATRRYGKPEFGLDHTLIDGVAVPVVEQIVLRKPFGQLKRFKRATGHSDPRLLIVAPMSGHFATLLRGTVEAMLPDHDVYITDWRDARNVPLSEGHFDLDDYIDYVIDFLHLLGPGSHVMAVCQPSVPVLAAVSIMAAQDDPCVPASMVLMGGPIDTREAPTEVNLFAKSHPLDWFERHLIQRVPAPYPGFMRQVYPGFLQLAGFMGMNFERHVDAHREMFHHLIEGDEESAAATREFYEEYRAVMDMTAEFYLQTLVTVFREHLLPRGAMVSHGRKVEPAAITRTALMTVEGERDDISGLGQTRAAHRLCRNLPEPMHVHYEQKKVGHYGIFNGRKWREQIAPRVKAFILAHDHATKAQESTAKAAG